jgi:hypothetical protein
MAKVITATAVPKIEPIVDPIPKLYEQFASKWAQTWVRPPPKADGTEITSADELDQAHDKKLNVWQGAACHATCVSMVVNWLVNQCPLTAGRVKVPNRNDEKAAVDPLHACH